MLFNVALFCFCFQKDNYFSLPTDHKIYNTYWYMQIHVVIKIFPWFETFLKPQKMYIQTTKYIVHDLYKGGGGGE